MLKEGKKEVVPDFVKQHRKAERSRPIPQSQIRSTN